MPRQFLVFAAALALVAAPAWPGTATIELPQIGDPADRAMSPADEGRLGAQVVSELYREQYIAEDQEVTEYLSAVGWKLAAADAVNETQPKFNFYLIADDRINAFALPGGYIGFNAGTIVAADNESELAAVMAHEESHVTQRHMARQAGDTQTADIATWLAALAAILAGSANPNVVIGALSVAQGINYQRQVTYTRGNEAEADRFGIRKLAAAGYDPMAMVTFFDKMEQQTRLYGSHVPEILLTHPYNTTRMAEATERAAQYGPRKVGDSTDFLLMRARTRVLAADSPNEALAYFLGQINTGHDTPENRYGQALALSVTGQNEAALKALEPALAAYPRQPNLLLAQADFLQGAGRSAQALEVYAHAVSQYPRYAPAILQYADALTQNGKPDQARQLLLSHDQALGTRIDTYKLLANAARAAGNTAEAQYQMASYMYRRGDLRSAIEALNAALRVASISPEDRARLVARRQELLDTIPKEDLARLQRSAS
jgi:predicted Zn-dependent protease